MINCGLQRGGGGRRKIKGAKTRCRRVRRASWRHGLTQCSSKWWRTGWNMHEFPRLRGAHGEHVTDPPPPPLLLLILLLLSPPSPPPPLVPPPPPSDAVAARPVGEDSINLLHGTSSSSPPLPSAMCSQCAAGKWRSSPAASLITHLLPSVRKSAEQWVCGLVSADVGPRRWVAELRGGDPGGEDWGRLVLSVVPVHFHWKNVEGGRGGASMIGPGLLFIF